MQGQLDYDCREKWSSAVNKKEHDRNILAIKTWYLETGIELKLISEKKNISKQVVTMEI